MTPKQLRFVAEYLIDLNATAAARRAGYGGTDEALRVTASRMLTKPNVSDAINVAMEERGQRTKVTADRVLLEIERMALIDVCEFVDVKSPADLAKMPAKHRQAVVGWSWDKCGNFVLKFAKESALSLLGRHHKLFTEVIEHKGTFDLVRRLAAARKRSGVEAQQAHKSEHGNQP